MERVKLRKFARRAGAVVLGLVALDLLATGGDRAAAESVLELPELRALRQVPRRELAGLPDPTRSVLDRAVEQVRSVDVRVVDTAPPG